MGSAVAGSESGTVTARTRKTNELFGADEGFWVSKSPFQCGHPRHFYDVRCCV